MDLAARYPALSDLKRAARRRLPRFVWEYLDSGTGDEATKARNRARLDRVGLMPSVLHGEFTPDLTTQFLGQSLPLPFGIAPVGMSGLIWPDAERLLARVSAKASIPYCLSTVSAKTPEQVAPHIGDQGWFQLYPPRDPEVRRDMLARAEGAGFHTLILTVDVPVASRRERLRKARLSNPMRMTPRIIAQAAMRPTWALNLLSEGIPHLATLEKYVTTDANLPPTAHAGYLLRTAPDWDYVAALKDEWHGKLVLKGVLDPQDATQAVAAGVDALWVSNHGGRQFSIAPPAIEALPHIRAAVGPDYPLIFDSGVRSGSDILRAIAMGADFVMLGRGFLFGLAAFGQKGAEHVVHILREQLIADMGQLGVKTLRETRERLNTWPD
ncbi:MAG: alpha-hydroxy-acid oxidizing protein [Alphaproteobacteria bacterium]|nr:alpha-hydroxy-acid oxidizing protein [Alphaproteobacteria bacterium]